MRILLKNGKVMGSHGDFESRVTLLENYGEGHVIRWVPDDTSLLPASDGGVADPRLIMDEGIVRMCIREDIDNRTDELIAQGFVYQSIQFKMDTEHQNTYMFSYLLNQTYPYTVKGVGENYLIFQDRNEHTTFIVSGFTACSTIIQTGWGIKESLDEMTKEEMLAWVDSR